MSKKYPKAFQEYWKRTDQTPYRGMTSFQLWAVERAAYRAWAAGRNYQRRTYG